MNAIKKTTILIVFALTLWFGWLAINGYRDKDSTARVQATASSSLREGYCVGEAAPGPQRTKAHGRDDQSALKERRESLNRLDDLLPPVDLSSKSTLIEVKLSLGESLAIGGFKTKDGHINASIITLTKTPDGGSSYTVKSQMLLLDPATVDTLGLGALKDGGSKKFQQYVRLTPESKAMQSHGENPGIRTLNGPSVSANPEHQFHFSIGNDDQADYAMSGMISEDDGGDGVLLRMRVEYDAKLEP